jgi:hypothetical protein
MPDRKENGKIVYIREKRRAPRRRLWLPSHLIDESGVTRPCLLLNLSTKGAAIRLDDADAVISPTSGHVVLVIGGHDAMRYSARIAWRKGQMIGLNFNAADDSSA